MNEEFSKTEAAQYLGVSVRALERYTQQARVGVRYVKGRAKPTPVYDQNELDRFKTELEKVTNRPAVQVLEQSDTNRQTELATMADRGELALQVLAQFMESQSATKRQEDMALLADRVVLGQKPLLKLDEAALLTGLSRQTLRAAIADGTLKAAQIGRTWRMRRTDVDKYLQELF